MSSYEYESALFNTRRGATIAMCADWLLTQGINGWESDEVQAALANPAQTAAEMAGQDWNTLAIVGRYDDDDGEQIYETVPTSELQDVLEQLATERLIVA